MTKKNMKEVVVPYTVVEELHVLLGKFMGDPGKTEIPFEVVAEALKGINKGMLKAGLNVKISGK
jgi:hypothetical protein